MFHRFRAAISIDRCEAHPRGNLIRRSLSFRPRALRFHPGDTQTRDQHGAEAGECGLALERPGHDAWRAGGGQNQQQAREAREDAHRNVSCGEKCYVLWVPSRDMDDTPGLRQGAVPLLASWDTGIRERTPKQGWR